ncbi:MAG: ATPase, partial [Planctomycetes bacterium]|nr:ATPase [Planctomycetota bacterium]
KDEAWQESLQKCLGDDALDLQSLAESNNQTLGGNAVPMGLGDFFFPPGDPLHPDFDDLEGDFDDDENAEF